MSELISTCLILAALAAGFWLKERETRQKRRGWKPYRRCDVMSEWRNG